MIARDVTKTTLVVVNEHTFGYIQPHSNSIGVLHTSILRGSPLSYWTPSIDPKGYNVRMATREDFDTYRMEPTQYERDSECEFVR